MGKVQIEIFVTMMQEKYGAIVEKQTVENEVHAVFGMKKVKTHLKSIYL